MSFDCNDIVHLLNEISDGNEIAFGKLFDRYKGKVYSFALYLMHFQDMADEVTQRVFVKIWNHRAQLSGIENFENWLSVVVRNETYSVLKKMAREKQVLNNFQDKTPGREDSLESNLISKENDQLLQKAIDQLPPQQKKVYMLSRFEGMKNAAIAREMDLSVFTVKNHIKAALRSIRNFLKTYGAFVILLLWRN